MKASVDIGFGSRLLALALIAQVAGCGDGGTRGNTLARLEAFDDGQVLQQNGIISVSAGTLAVGEEQSVSELRFVNTASDDLVITKVEIESDPAGAFRLAGSPEGDALPAFPLTIAPQDGDDLNAIRSARVYVLYTRQAPSDTLPSATVRVYSNSVSTSGVSQPEIEFLVRLQSSAPSIQVTPRVVNFGTVQQGQTELQSINILNPGGEMLLVNSFSLTADQNFELVIGSTQYPATPAAAAGILLDPPLEVPPGVTVPVSVRYTAETAAAGRGQVVFFSNDPAAAAGTVVALQANVGGPCIALNPRKVAFGGKKIGNLATIDVEVTSCGDQALELSEIVLTPESSSLFSLSLASVPGVSGSGTLGPADPPVVLQPNQKTTITVEYFPETISPVDGNNQPIYDTATLRIRSNSFQPQLEAEVTGFGVEKECPTAIIVVPQGEEVIPQTTLNLVGSQSTSSTGQISQYKWEVEPPEGSASRFFPSDTAPDPQFEVNIAGRYLFRLTVVDSAGEPSCVAAEYEVFVNPDEAIHIELLWKTPNDADEGDGNGSDLDLHFAHPLAVGGYDGDGDGVQDGWFDDPFDVFWAVDQPNWGSLDANVDDNPSLDRDDTDGAGPENLNLNMPEANTTYRVGVNYWTDHDFGTSYATIRVFIFANLVFEVTEVELFKHDMWEVTRISWPPSGEAPKLVKVCGGTTESCESDADCGAAKCGMRIAPNYRHPRWFQP